MGTKTTEEFLKSLSAYHEVFDIADDPEYSETQLLEFAKEYADHLSTSQKETIERLKMSLENLYDAAFTAVSHVAVANYQSREIEAKNLIRTAYEQAEQLLKELDN